MIIAVTDAYFRNGDTLELDKSNKNAKHPKKERKTRELLNEEIMCDLINIIL